MHNVLSIIGEKLNNNNVTWGLGGSLLLHYYQLINQPNDIDILIDDSDVPKFNELKSSFGEPQEAVWSDPFRTAYFSKYKINNIGIDIMGGFAIEHDAGIYRLSFTGESIVAHQKVNGVYIPLCSLEDWYILYWLIPGKQEKAILIENYLRTNGVHHRRLLDNALKQQLPSSVKEKVINLLS